jgi:hypothetical protein
LVRITYPVKKGTQWAHAAQPQAVGSTVTFMVVCGVMVAGKWLLTAFSQQEEGKRKIPVKFF